MKGRGSRTRGWFGVAIFKNFFDSFLRNFGGCQKFRHRGKGHFIGLRE